ncbi:hypothetical protein HG536_0B05040 [Torulaspora globosa]|uniref:Nucleolar complex protein 14 n=1 Tax=Torulaspora globosa TaxID=48254 RepID=A0A7G3ZDQ4_9SACH|nr:uncharacterized protein HG536_0B05040 [Torulaspora globosa]QLL31640.1 hypothetical protein HG536_0B05040 [Torulaspora globosa]
MAGSQLKQLKATLKAHNLTGQTNGGKKKKGSKRQPKQYDREERSKVIAQIRETFSPFEVKKVKNKRIDDSSIPVGKPGISKQIGEEQRRKVYEAKQAHRNKSNGFLDRRFGERNKHMSEEDKMLERFTRERQSQSRVKSSLFDLNDDDDDDGGMFQTGLTHLGEALHDDFDEGDLGLDDEDNEVRATGRSKRSLDYGENGSLGEPAEPARKKTKAEVMKEIIAKSKFYKQERQKAQEKLEDQIDELDENFGDIFSELKASSAAAQAAPELQDQTDKEYDIKVKELIMEKRAAPSDRTKTPEELKKEVEEKRAQLERQRNERMSGILELEDGEERGVEDLDDGFWANSDDEEELGEGSFADSDEDIELEQSPSDEAEFKRDRELRDLPCPGSHEELLAFLKGQRLVDQPKQIRRIIHAHQPKLAEGNKEKLGHLTAVLLQHILFLSNQDYSKNLKEFAEVQNSMLKILQSLSEQYNQALSKECRKIISTIQERFKKNQFTKVLPSDLVFFNLVGVIFSTSDQYHLVVTPCSILIAEFLEQAKFNTIEKLAFGAAFARTSLQYQRIAKRYVPELTFFFEKCLASLLPDPSAEILHQVKIDSTKLAIENGITLNNEQSATLHLHQFSGVDKLNDGLRCTLLMNVLESVKTAISLIWKELPAFQEITFNIVKLLEEYVAKFSTLEPAQQILERIEKLCGFNDHTPLTLQHHKPISIPSHAPKFEENFNPDKKSYDPDKTRSEINKMKSLLKKERKFTMKEIRKDAKFEARQRIASQKESAAQYHSKMAHIINTISTEEGSEKNKYEREKKLRSIKK